MCKDTYIFSYANPSSKSFCAEETPKGKRKTVYRRIVMNLLFGGARLERNGQR